MTYLKSCNETANFLLFYFEDSCREATGGPVGHCDWGFQKEERESSS